MPLLPLMPLMTINGVLPLMQLMPLMTINVYQDVLILNDSDGQHHENMVNIDSSVENLMLSLMSINRFVILYVLYISSRQY